MRAHWSPTRALLGLCLALWACSDSLGSGEVRTVLLTDSYPNPYVLIAVDQSGDTIGGSNVSTSAPSCLSLSRAGTGLFAFVRFDSYDAVSGFLIGETTVRPASGSWAWDGVSSSAVPAPHC